MARRTSIFEEEHFDHPNRSSLFDIQQRPIGDCGSSIISLSDVSSIVKRGPRLQYENTFKMEPDFKYEISKIKDIIDEVLEEKFKDFIYSPLYTGSLCKTTSQAIKDAVKKLELDRYKIICTVTVSENSGQGVKQASRFLWDSNRDNWVDSTYKTSTLIAQATLYALYYE